MSIYFQNSERSKGKPNAYYKRGAFTIGTTGVGAIKVFRRAPHDKSLQRDGTLIKTEHK
jgi:hypothetical protein